MKCGHEPSGPVCQVVSQRELEWMTAMVCAIFGAAVAAGGAVGASTTVVWSRCSVTRSSTAVVPLTETARTVSVSAGFVGETGTSDHLGISPRPP